MSTRLLLPVHVSLELGEVLKLLTFLLLIRSAKLAGVRDVAFRREGNEKVSRVLAEVLVLKISRRLLLTIDADALGSEEVLLHIAKRTKDDRRLAIVDLRLDPVTVDAFVRVDADLHLLRRRLTTVDLRFLLFHDLIRMRKDSMEILSKFCEF